MDCRINGLSDQWTVRPVDCRTNGLSDQWIIEPMDCRTSGLSDQWTVPILNYDQAYLLIQNEVL